MAQHRDRQEHSLNATANENGQPRRWWQWFLLYPGLLIAIVGAVPTYMEAIKAYSFGVPFGRSYDAGEQNRLWQENFDCAQKAIFAMIRNKKNVEIGSFVCESGDVLLRGKRPEWDQHQLRWVSWNEVAPGASRSAFLEIFRSAYASEKGNIELAQVWQPYVLCQRWVGQGQLLQRIATQNGCFDQVINTYNGWVMSSARAPCTPQC